MDQSIKEYYINSIYNCAEMMLILANRDFELKISNETIKLFSGFGNGLHTENVCGVITGGIAVLSKIFVKGETLKAATVEFQEKVGENLSSTMCKDIKLLHREERNKCGEVIDKSYMILRNIIYKYREKVSK
ncbi:MAG: C-GCAxxG-C-C family (seleno)protein [Candidatus Izemoplasmatales bacterium]